MTTPPLRLTDTELDLGQPLSFGLAVLAAHRALHAWDNGRRGRAVTLAVLAVQLLTRPIRIAAKWENS
jgi:hypothetical protein